MLQKLNKNQKGFTLVEIMIVVAIIALLAAIAVPNFLRARERSQASAILEEMRLIAAAIDQTALEENAAPNAAVNWALVQQRIKPGTRLADPAVTVPEDILGNAIGLTNYNELPTLHADTIAAFDVDVVPAEFWQGYAP